MFRIKWKCKRRIKTTVAMEESKAREMAKSIVKSGFVVIDIYPVQMVARVS